MELKRFKLTWSDGVKATYPDIKTHGKYHVYEFRCQTEGDARKFIQSFARLNPHHNFANYKLEAVETTKGKKK